MVKNMFAMLYLRSAVVQTLIGFQFIDRPRHSEAAAAFKEVLRNRAQAVDHMLVSGLLAALHSM